MSSPNFHTKSLYFNHSSPYKLLYYAWVTCDYISRKISPRNWFQCFPVHPRCRSGSVSLSGSGSVSGFRISWFSIRPFHRGKPVPFANRAPSWIFEARAPGYERVSVKIERGGRGREGETAVPSFPLFAPPAPLPRVTFLSTTARPAPPRRVLSSQHRVFSPKRNSNAYR